MSSWGYPFLEPAPQLTRYLQSEQFTNFSGYSNAEVDEALAAMQVTRDFDEQYELFTTILEHANEDLPFWPYIVEEAGFLVAPEVHGFELFDQYVIRPDLMWLES